MTDFEKIKKKATQTAGMTHFPSHRRLWKKQTKPWLKMEVNI